MDIIRNALCNILDDEDLLLLENHSLDQKYKISYYTCRNVTRLMLLINFLDKYPQISNIIEQYVKEVPGEINKINDNDQNALDICIIECDVNIKIIKIMLNNGANINQRYGSCIISYCRTYCYFNIMIMQLILEHEQINVKSYFNAPLTICRSNNQEKEVEKIVRHIALLNTKN